MDCGDTIHGTLPAIKSKGKDMLPILNRLGIDAMTAHWEFAYGPDNFKEVVEKLNYPMLAINCYDERTDELVFDPYLIKEINGLRVGIIGISATIVDKVMPGSFSKGIYFTLGNKELPGFIQKLRQEKEVDLIVVLSHLGFSQEVKLAREVEDIDVIFSGHTHNRLYKPAIVNDTIIIQSGCHGSFLGYLKLKLNKGKIVDYNHELITLDSGITPDPEVEKEINRIMAPYQGELNQIVGYTETALNRNTALESTMDNFLLDSMIDLTGADMAFSNGWRYGAPVIPGPITMYDLWNIIPVNPPISVVELTGKELQEMMEENLERTFARDPYQQMGGYVKRSGGINLYFKIENPFGQRIQRLFVQGEKVISDRTYKTVFVTTQGVPAKYGTNRRDLDIKAIDNLKRYLKKKGTINAKLQNSIIPV